MVKQSHESSYSLVGNITVDRGAEGGVHEYFEQYEGYFSNGWKTNLDSAAAFRVLEDSGLVAQMGEYEISDDARGGWIVDTEAGSIYWTIDESGTTIAGVLAPDDIDTQLVSRWYAVSACETSAVDSNNTTGYVS